jgi:hypothetical protein
MWSKDEYTNAGQALVQRRAGMPASVTLGDYSGH